MTTSKTQPIVHVAKEVFADAVSLLSDAFLGKPIKAQAHCYVDYTWQCNALKPCGECGIGKRKYVRVCDCNPPVHQHCVKGCVCDYC